MQEMERSQVQEMNQERRAEKKERQEDREYGPEPAPSTGAEIGVDQYVLPEEPVARLSKILQVHGVPVDTVSQILGIFQLHPGYQDNPVNLHFLLTAKLKRQFHSSIPMMISAFTTQEGQYPEGIPFIGGPGMATPGVMPPYMAGGGYGYSPFYPQYVPYGYSPRQPIGHREEYTEEESGGRRGKGGSVSPLQEAVNLLGSMAKTMDEMRGGSEKSEGTVSETLVNAFAGLSETLEKIVSGSTEEKESQKSYFETQIAAMKESNEATLKEIRDQLHHEELSRKDDEINRLRDEREEEMSAGLGELLREAGQGIGSQVEAVRESISQGANRVGGIIESVLSGSEATPTGKSRRKLGKQRSRTIQQAADLLELESDINSMAEELGGGKD